MTTQPLYRLALAQSADHAHVDRLRIDAYAGASYFELKDTRHLQVEQDPTRSAVLCAWDGASLAATVRLAAARVPRDAFEMFGFELPQGVPLPAAVFSRGAVDPAYRGQGWMPFLLTLGVRMAQRLGLGCALGAQAAGTPHQNAMLRAGWQVQDVQAMEDEGLALKTTTQFLWLERVRFETAVQHGLGKAEGLLTRCDGASLLALTSQVQAAARTWDLAPATLPVQTPTRPEWELSPAGMP